MEIWKAIPAFAAYEVSNLGRVRTISTRQGTWAGRILKSCDDKEGYQQISLGRGTKFKVHRLVLAAFIGPCPLGFEVSHEDDNPRNNGLINLSYKTKAENLARRRLLRGDDWRAARGLQREAA